MQFDLKNELDSTVTLSRCRKPLTEYESVSVLPSAAMTVTFLKIYLDGVKQKCTLLISFKYGTWGDKHPFGHIGDVITPIQMQLYLWLIQPIAIGCLWHAES